MTCFFLALFGFCMITLRAAYRVSVDEHDDKNDNAARGDWKKGTTAPIYPPLPYENYPTPDECNNHDDDDDDGVSSLGTPTTPHEAYQVDDHMTHPLAVTSSVSPLPVPSDMAQAKREEHWKYNDDGLDC